jgi:hypothetical protein
MRMANRSPSLFAVTCLLLGGASAAFAQLAPPPPPSDIDASRSAQFQERVDEAARRAEQDPRFKDLTQEQRKALVAFVAGNMLFALVHEMGHALISEMGLPVLGHEEDAADSYAVLAMLRVGTTLSHRVLVEAANGWFLSDERDRAEGLKPAYYDEHSLDRQRAYSIVCLMVGSDPDRFSDLATKVNMPDERQGTCGGDYSNALWSWQTVLKPHMRAPDQPQQKIGTVYEPAEGRLGVIANTFRAIQLLETVATYEAERYVWRRPITLEAKPCGLVWAHWDLSTQKITICYEMAADFSDLYHRYGLTPEAKP